MSCIRHIIFDLSEVLILGIAGCENEIAADLGIESQSVRQALYNDRWYALLRGEITERQYIDTLITENGWQISHTQMQRRFRERFATTLPDTIKIARNLANNFALTLLSDHVREWVPEVLEQHPFIEELFSLRIFSFEVGILKRERTVFKILLERLEASPGECLFVDDHIKNVAAAQSLEIDCIRFTDPLQLRCELEERGIAT